MSCVSSIRNYEISSQILFQFALYSLVVQFLRTVPLSTLADSFVSIALSFSFVKYFLKLFSNFFDSLFRAICFSLSLFDSLTIIALSIPFVNTFLKTFSNYFQTYCQLFARLVLFFAVSSARLVCPLFSLGFPARFLFGSQSITHSCSVCQSFFNNFFTIYLLGALYNF